MDLNRRQILCGLGGIACGAACAGLINLKEDAHAASEKNAALPAGRRGFRMEAPQA